MYIIAAVDFEGKRGRCKFFGDFKPTILTLTKLVIHEIYEKTKQKLQTSVG
jgi:hypothetical protein